jgi:hypothetical protein
LAYAGIPGSSGGGGIRTHVGGVIPRNGFRDLRNGLHGPAIIALGIAATPGPDAVVTEPKSPWASPFLSSPRRSLSPHSCRSPWVSASCRSPLYKPVVPDWLGKALVAWTPGVMALVFTAIVVMIVLQLTGVVHFEDT